MDRREFFSNLGIIKEGPQLTPLTINAMKKTELELFKSESPRSPHGREWHTSFHGSDYPGGEKACKRKLLYTLMDLPNQEPMSPRLRGQAEVGKSVEYLIVHRWINAGMVLEMDAPDWYGKKMRQAGFEDPSTWLTGSVDAILDIRPHWPAVLPVDIKSKDHEVVRQMQINARSYDEKHYLQLQAYLYFCIKCHNEMGWDKLGLEPAQGGIIYYVSRQDPTFTAEFYVKADGMLMADAQAVLMSAKEDFLADRLPPRDKSWSWQDHPCKWCDFKKNVCKPDNKDKVTQLSKTNGVRFAKSIRPNYDPQEKRKRVLDRWMPQES